MVKLSVLFASIFALLTFGAVAGGPQQVFWVGSWKAGAYTNDETGAFINCGASAASQNGIGFIVIIDHEYQWQIAFINGDWRFRPKEKVPVELSFDKGRGLSLTAEAVEPDLLLIEMPDDGRVVKRFRHAYNMQMRIFGGSYNFPLTQTVSLLPALAGCVERNRHNAPRAAPAPAKTNSPVGSSAQGAKLEAMHLATNFILQGNFQNPRVLGESEIPPSVQIYDVVWQADGVYGGVKIIGPRPGVGGVEVAAAVAADESQSCKGKFASGRTSELLDDKVVFRGFATCEDSSASAMVQFFVVPRRDNGFVIFSVASTNFMSQDTETVNKNIARYQQAALEVVETR